MFDSEPAVDLATVVDAFACVGVGFAFFEDVVCEDVFCVFLDGVDFVGVVSFGGVVGVAEWLAY